MSSPRAGLGFWLGMLVLSALSTFDVWCVRYLPTNDGPQHILTAHIENHYADPGSIYAQTLLPLPQFADRGFATLYAPLESLLGWRNGLRVALTVMVLGFAWSFAAAVIAFEPRRRGVAYLGFVLAWMWPLYMGFFSFVIGEALGLVALAIALRAPNLDWRTTLALTGVFAVGAGAHVLTAVVAWGVLAVIVVARAEKGERMRVGARVLVPLAIPFAVFATAALLHVGWSNPVRYVPFATRMHTLTRLLAPGPAWRAWAFVAVLVAALVLAAARLRVLRREERAALAMGLVVLLFGLLAPRDIRNWEFFSPRFLPVGASLVFLATPFERIAGAARPLFSFSALALVATAAFHQRLARGCADVLDGLDAPIHRTGMNLPIDLNSKCGVSSDPALSEVPYMSALHHVGALYATAQGGSTPWLFIGSPGAHAFRARPDGLKVPVPDWVRYHRIFDSPRFTIDRAYRRSVLLEIFALGSASEGIIVTGAHPSDVALLREQGFALDYARGSVALAHFEPCKLDVTIPRAVADRPIRIESGASDLPFVMSAVENAEPRVGGDLAHFELPRGPCGDVWVHVRTVTRRGADIVETTCTNADDGGRIHAQVPRPGATVACDGIRD